MDSRSWWDRAFAWMDRPMRAPAFEFRVLHEEVRQDTNAGREVEHGDGSRTRTLPRCPRCHVPPSRAFATSAHPGPPRRGDCSWCDNCAVPLVLVSSQAVVILTPEGFATR